MTSKQKFIILLILFVFFISCKKQTKNIKDEITVNLGYELNTIDPALNDETYGYIYINHAFEGLLNKDINGNIVGGVADKWEISDDSLFDTRLLRLLTFTTSVSRLVTCPASFLVSVTISLYDTPCSSRIATTASFAESSSIVSATLSA